MSADRFACNHKGWPLRTGKDDDAVRKMEEIRYKAMSEIGATYGSASPLESESESDSVTHPLQVATATATVTDTESENESDAGSVIHYGHFITNAVNISLPALEWYQKAHGALYRRDVDIAKRLYEERSQ